MDYWKEMPGEKQECDYSPPDRYVCPACVTDPYLATILAAEQGDELCSYCGGDKAVHIYVLCDEMRKTIALDYYDPAEVLPYESREGGYQGEVLFGSVVYEFDPWTECDKLVDDIATAFAGNVLCKPVSDHYQMLRYSWQHFTEQVKHRTRYLFLQNLGTDRGYGDDKIFPGEMLDALGELFREFDLFYELPRSTDLVRVRVYESASHQPATAAELGTAPRELATRPNRMSPAGIPMFYAALDEVTAVLEAYDPTADKDREIALARFHNKRPLMLLDLTDLPAIPSEFDLGQRYERPRIAFLRDFESDFTKPIERATESGHTEYVPTQIVTEFVRHCLRTTADEPIDGVLYRSSRARASTAVAVVIFADPEHCGPRAKREPIDLAEVYLDLIDVRYVNYSDFESRIQAISPIPGDG